MERHEVLRVNCDGFGQISNLSAGAARPLHNYKVIVINPISILHLFDKDPAILIQIEHAQEQGLASYIARSDKLIESLKADLECRKQEMLQFLDQGGLLVYFLTKPFKVQGIETSMDNYEWLGSLAPDNPNNPAIKGERNMTALSNSGSILLSSIGLNSSFANYFGLPDLEWTTLVRNDNLTPGYIPLAGIEPNKCISAMMPVGNNGGLILFLPAPYKQHFDTTITYCFDTWANSPKVLPSTTPKLAVNFNIPDVKPEAQSTTNNDFNESNVEFASREEVPWDAPREIHSQAAQLMDKIESVSKSNNPDWCQNCSFDYLENLQQELSTLKESIASMKEQVDCIESKISTTTIVKDALVAGDDNSLQKACTAVFEDLGWKVVPCGDLHGRFNLVSNSNVVEAIVHIIRTANQPDGGELAHLAKSIIDYWSNNQTEPKGILVASTFANLPPQERPENDFAETFTNYASQKNFCLMNALQLLAIYQARQGNDVTAEELRQEILSSNGLLNGFRLTVIQSTPALI